MVNDARERILVATLDLIGEHGIGGLSNRLVARAAEVSLGTLTYHFPSQDDLLAHALEAFVDGEVARLEALTEALEGTELSFDQALRVVREIIEDQAGRRAQIAQFELNLQATRNRDLAAASARCYAAYDRVGTAALHAIGVPDAERVAPMLAAMVDGLELRRLAIGEGPSLDEAIGRFLAGPGGDQADGGPSTRRT